MYSNSQKITKYRVEKGNAGSGIQNVSALIIFIAHTRNTCVAVSHHTDDIIIISDKGRFEWGRKYAVIHRSSAQTQPRWSSSNSSPSGDRCADDTRTAAPLVPGIRQSPDVLLSVLTSFSDWTQHAKISEIRTALLEGTHTTLKLWL